MADFVARALLTFVFAAGYLLALVCIAMSGLHAVLGLFAMGLVLLTGAYLSETARRGGYW